MPKRSSKQPDYQQLARRVLDAAAPDADSTTSPEMEAAWSTWSKQIQNVDERTMTLLRAAFEAGWDAKVPDAAALGRRGGKKGGKARAAKLTPERRREIAKKAAAKRWSKG